MNKAVTTPAAKSTNATAPVAAKPTTPIAPAKEATAVAPVKAETTAPVVAAEPKKLDMSKQSIKDAIAKGKAIIKEGKSKADAAMVIFEALKDEEKEVVIAFFFNEAATTEKGSVTYWYNCRRKAKKAAAKTA